MSELAYSLTFADVLDVTRDDSGETIRVMQLGLTLSRSILDYLEKDSLSELGQFEEELVDNASSVVRWTCRQAPVKTAKIGMWLESPSDSSTTTPFERLLVEPRYSAGYLIGNANSVVMLDYATHIGIPTAGVLPERLEH